MSHAPDGYGYRALSVAMVNVREGLALCREAGVISPGTHDLLREHAERKLLRGPRLAGPLERGDVARPPATSWMGSQALVAREKPDLKREDAARLLEHV